MYMHIIKRPTKRTPTPSLHKDSDLGVPTSPLRFYLRGFERVMVWVSVRREINAILCF